MARSATSFGKCCIFKRLYRVKIQGTMAEPERPDYCDSDLAFRCSIQDYMDCTYQLDLFCLGQVLMLPGSNYIRSHSKSRSNIRAGEGGGQGQICKKRVLRVLHQICRVFWQIFTSALRINGKSKCHKYHGIQLFTDFPPNV